MRKKPFFVFLNVWSSHEQFVGVVREACEERVEGNSMYVQNQTGKSKSRAEKVELRDFGNIFEKSKNIGRKGEGVKGDTSE